MSDFSDSVSAVSPCKSIVYTAGWSFGILTILTFTTFRCKLQRHGAKLASNGELANEKGVRDDASTPIRFRDVELLHEAGRRDWHVHSSLP